MDFSWVGRVAALVVIIVITSVLVEQVGVFAGVKLDGPSWGKVVFSAAQMVSGMVLYIAWTWVNNDE